VYLIVFNLAIGFWENVDWRAHIGGMLVGAGLALALDYSQNRRDLAQRVGVAVGSSVLTLALLALLATGIAPGHVNLS
jgi:hypothetical protein